jgi:hypothetical protein
MMCCPCFSGAEKPQIRRGCFFGFVNFWWQFCKITIIDFDPASSPGANY